MKIKRAYRYLRWPYTLLRIEFEDGPDATITCEAYRWFYSRHCDIVFLGSKWEDLTSAEFRGQRLRGFTDDAKVVSVVKDYVTWCNRRDEEYRAHNEQRYAQLTF